jgi:hypothetical protein
MKILKYKLLKSRVKNFSTFERIIGWPPLIISGPMGAGKVNSK